MQIVIQQYILNYTFLNNFIFYLCSFNVWVAIFLISLVAEATVDFWATLWLLVKTRTPRTLHILERAGEIRWGEPFTVTTRVLRLPPLHPSYLYFYAGIHTIYPHTTQGTPLQYHMLFTLREIILWSDTRFLHQGYDIKNKIFPSTKFIPGNLPWYFGLSNRNLLGKIISIYNMNKTGFDIWHPFENCEKKKCLDKYK